MAMMGIRMMMKTRTPTQTRTRIEEDDDDTDDGGLMNMFVVLLFFYGHCYDHCQHRHGHRHHYSIIIIFRNLSSIITFVASFSIIVVIIIIIIIIFFSSSFFFRPRCQHSASKLMLGPVQGRRKHGKRGRPRRLRAQPQACWDGRDFLWPIGNMFSRKGELRLRIWRQAHLRVKDRNFI